MYHTVKNGEYLSLIASEVNKAYGTNSVTVQKLVDWNKKYYPSLEKNPNAITAGWKLYVGIDGQPDTRKNPKDPNQHDHATLNSTGEINAAVSVYKSCIPNIEEVLFRLHKGDRVTVTKKCETGSENDWTYNIKTIGGATGWVNKAAVDLDIKVEKQDAERLPEYGTAGATDDTAIEEFVNNLKNIGKTTNVSFTDLLIDDNIGIHGMPYQFMDDVDNRLSDEIKFGRTYIDRIVSKMPLLLLTPGRANFMPAYSKVDQSKVKSALLEKGLKDTDVIANNLEKLLTGSNNHRYFTFEFQFKEYYYYVNKMLRYCAACLNIQDELYPCHGNDGVKMKTFGEYTWDFCVNDKLKGFLSSREFVAFFADAVTSISEDISSSTTHSMLSDSFNGLSGMAKEVQFLAGPIAGADFIAKNMDPNTFNEEVNSIFSGLDNAFDSTLFERLSNGFETVAKGGHLLFPEIWDDSEFSKSYSVDFKLRTPDGDKISWYLNICVPLIHLLAFAAPREMGVNGYMSPFLCRAYYKGLFNVDMGIITNMSISKGKEGAWTIDGLPTEVDVSITIKELYQALAISGGSVFQQLEEPFKFFRNTAMIDYLSTTCGININKPELDRIGDLYVMFMQNIAKDALSIHYGSQWTGLEQGAVNFVSDIYNALLFRR